MSHNIINSYSGQPRHSTLKGTLSGFFGEALILPTGLVTAILLTRWLEPKGYGLFTLAATIVSWVESSAASIFSRTTIKFIREAEDWRPVGTTVLQQQLLVSTIMALLLCLFALPIAQLMSEPTFTIYLLLFAVEIPLFAVAKAHRMILTGLGKFSEQAIAGGSRWIARLILIVLLVGLGFSVPGAILGTTGASLVELLISRFYIRPPLFCHSSFPVNQLWDYAVPLTLYSLTMRFYEKLDLLMLKVLGGTAESAGIYGAAQNLSIIPALFAMSFGPVLLSNISGLLRDGNLDKAKTMSQQAMRVVLLMFALAAIMAGTAPEIVNLIFGKQYTAASPILAVLMFGAIAQVLISVSTVILIAASKPNWIVALTAPMLPLAIIGYLLLIPKFSGIGAAIVTTFVAICASVTAVLAVYRIWKILPPLQTLWRTIVVCGFAYVLAAYLPSPGLWLVLKLGACALFVPLGFIILGEFSTSEIALIPLPFVQKLLNRGKF